MCPTLVPTGALVCLRTLAPLGHIPVFRVYLVMGGGAPSWATATGPGLFRSLGFRNPSGYWLLRRSTYKGREGWAAPGRLHVVWVCVLYRCSLGWVP